MSKYISRANELLDRVRSFIELFEVQKNNNGWGDDYFAPDKITYQYPEILLDVQTLFFCESPQFPLYVQSMGLNERKDLVLKRCGDRFSYSDFKNLEKLLLRYLEYRAFLEATD